MAEYGDKVNMARCNDSNVKIALFLQANLGDIKAKKKFERALMSGGKCECVDPYITKNGKIVFPYFRCRKSSNR